MWFIENIEDEHTSACMLLYMENSNSNYLDGLKYH